MANLLASINVALTALLSHSQATTVYEHNVANVNTPGYHRQNAKVTAGPAVSLSNAYYGTGIGQMGSGVYVTAIQRYAVDFYDTRYRLENQEASKWSAESEIVAQLEASLLETSTDGLLPKIEAYFSNWQAASDDPTNTSVRRQLLDSAKELASSINTRYSQIESIRSEQDLRIEQSIQEINLIAENIASLNREISRVMSIGDSPNDLLDARDVALDRLSEIAGATSFKQANGEVSVSINGHILVGGHDTYPLHTEIDPTNENLTRMVWSDGKEMVPTSGELAGVIEARDTIFEDQRTGLNTLSMMLKDQVNALHFNGYGLDNSTQINFFEGTDAGNFKVNEALEDVSKIALSSAINQPGNNEIGREIFKLRTTGTLNSDTMTFSQYYNDQISKLGLTVLRAKTNARDRSLVAQALISQRESVTGVSLNEEAANIAKSQKAYEAAARVISVIDEMLNTVINGMGAGR
ncbi:MAG: flagellar hook-associated protein FlgK [Chloroflexi bacterium HGW-Chloroflexi-4]|jgi:flagellar hook-associated protein 1 FlgK|nr:MAG: flagellar hook-associated protein FlgK [Chloroflexi bacterium HGW-Chloroflexi-4]